MLRKITLICFKQHVERTILFTPGVNGIRAPNGSGKSNALLAARYALYGAKALPEALEDVVTYGQPVSALKVVLELDHVGVAYRVSRSKSSAEATFGAQRVTGQNEVTKFFEQLFGASRDLASKLMFAKQKDVGGALKDGPTATSELIESLAELGLIDQIVGLVGEHLPAGNTDVQKNLVSTLREQAAPAEQIDLAPLQATVDAAVLAHTAAVAAHGAAEVELDNLDLDAAREILADEKLVLANVAGAKSQIKQAETFLVRDPLPPVEAGAIEALQQKVAEQKDLAAAEQIHAQLKRADTAMLWDEPLQALHDAVTAAQKAREKADGAQDQARAALRDAEKAETKAQSDRKLAIAKLEGKLVLDESCAFCGKDLKDVPEVALINNPLYAEIQKLKAAPAADLSKHAAWWEAKQAEYREAYGDLEALQTVVDVNNKLAPLYARAEKYVTLDESVVPAQWTWTGPTAAPQDFVGELAALQEQQRAYEKRVTQDEEHRKHLTAQQEKLVAAQARLLSLQLADARETLALEAKMKPDVRGLLEASWLSEKAVNGAQAAFTSARQRCLDQVLAAKRSAEQLAAAEVTLAEMEANNLLVKKLRAARPQIADKLWAMVLGAASTYYTSMRGQPGVFTRADGTFKINGKPCAGMSGAEEDLLGLSIRLALTKMFLPNVDFLVLDEVAAACDDAREEALLALMSTVGFPQVIMVSHSPAIDSVADNIITIE